MSLIFTPVGGSIPPQFSDGLENLLTRMAGLSTNSPAFATIAQVEIPPNVFSDIRNHSRIEFDFVGQIIGIAGIKQFRTRIDGVDVYVPASFNQTTNPGSFWVKLIMLYRNSQVIPYMRTMAGDGATGNLNVNSFGSPAAGFANFDPTVAHTVLLQALVANAADSIRCDLVGGSFR